MGKQGPCYHCGVTSTPLWRNGPPEKPILCNACGSRWRTKGTLSNYTPLHARLEPDHFEDYRFSRLKSTSMKTKEAKLHKRKQSQENIVVEGDTLQCDYNFRKVLEEDTSNRSSSGSAVSYSESCAQFGGTDASDLTGSAQSAVWDTLVPSRKRTCVSRPKPSSVEKLTKDLYSILHEQQSSYFSGSSEEDLLFESEETMVSVEIGHGSVLIRHPNLTSREEESEASSLSIDNKPFRLNEAHSGSAALPVHIFNKGVSFTSSATEKIKNHTGQGIQQEHPKRVKSHHEKFQILQSHSSPLRCIDLKDVVSFEEFERHLTHEEQRQLTKYLPSVDTARFSDSLKSMFDCPQFEENLSSFQKLLAEGVFNNSLSGVKTEDCKTLKRLALVNLTKSKWVEHSNMLKDVIRKNGTGGKAVEIGPTVLASSNLIPVKRPRDGQNQNFPESKGMMKSPKRVVLKASHDMKNLIDNEGSCFSPRSLFALPPDGSFMMDSFQFTDDTYNQDLLLDMPSNGPLPQAELLHPSSSFGAQQESTSSSVAYPNIFHS
ncbi:hypothetical protein HHK36_028094 [Tetracentron sinense]|uniref:GATA transcription factor n=1 Tax=Tetracentron sinense TaxID=13715 RepID=A0A835D446_TETSI|nr:hypothetical protein HHK36_028094 [Tetracentron sinense]